jgi:uncharacterized protein YydD (DUF2326 family)
MPDVLFPSEPFTITPAASRTEPPLWVRRLVVVDERSPGVSPRRVVDFRKGLNIVRVADRPPGEKRPVGHSVGKTLLTRLIRYCLGERRFAKKDETPKLRALLPAGHVIAEVVVQGTGWVVVRPFGDTSRKASFAGVSDDWRDGLDAEKVAAPLGGFEHAMTGAALVSLPELRLPKAKRPAGWLDLLGWLTRDQACNFSHYNQWRSRESDSRSPDLKRADASLVVQWALGLLDTTEADLRAAHLRLLNEKEKGERKVREATASRAASLRVLEERFSDLARDEEDSLVTRTATTEATQKVASLEGLLAELMEGVAVARLREQVGRLRARHHETGQRLAGLKATVQAKESQLETEKATGVGDAYGTPCLCPSKPAACPRSDRAQQAAAASIRRDKVAELEDAIGELRGQLRDAEQEATALGGELAEAETRLEAAAAQQLADVKGASEQVGAWRGYLKEIASYDASRGRLREAQQEVVRLDEEIGRSLERQRAAREAQRSKLGRLSEVYSHVLTRLAGQAAEGKIELDARGARPIPGEGLRANGQAMASLTKVLAFDLACLIASVEGTARFPLFLIHDSPKTADLESVLYARLYDPIMELLAAFGEREPSFQYIVTTTTPPPAAAEKYAWEPLHALSPEGRLLRAEF